MNFFKDLTKGLAEAFAWIIRWIAKPSMNKLILVGSVVAAWTFWKAWNELAEVSALPLCWFLTASLAGSFYLIDRIGFSKIDTISLLTSNKVLYAFYMAIYAVLVVVGHVLGLFVFNR